MNEFRSREEGGRTLPGEVIEEEYLSLNRKKNHRGKKLTARWVSLGATCCCLGLKMNSTCHSKGEGVGFTRKGTLTESESARWDGTGLSFALISMEGCAGAMVLCLSFSVSLRSRGGSSPIYSSL